MNIIKWNVIHISKIDGDYALHTTSKIPSFFLWLPRSTWALLQNIFKYSLTVRSQPLFFFLLIVIDADIMIILNLSFEYLQSVSNESTCCCCSRIVRASLRFEQSSIYREFQSFLNRSEALLIFFSFLPDHTYHIISYDIHILYHIV